ncbi:MAG TPA: CAP domain-containing protein [Actinomycetota bacterium]|jgi:hypothetical protein|nr:CAP domain-containing protein [Actinomycetota bacterium]
MRKQVAVTLGIAALLTPAPAWAQTFLPGDEARVIAMVNQTRAGRDLPPLRRVEGLVEVARAQSARMVDEQRLYHNPRLGEDLTGVGLDWHWSGENVGVGPNVQDIERAFLGSSHHLENIVRVNYDSIGVGVAADPDGYVYVTQVFADLSGIRPQLPAAAPAPTPTREPRTPPPAIPKSTLLPTPRPPDPIVVEGGIIWDGPVPARQPTVDLFLGVLSSALAG